MGFLGSILTLAAGAFFGPIGALVASLAFSFLTKSSTTTSGSRVSDFQTSQSEIGTPIPKIRGQMRIAGNVIWHRGFKEHSKKTKVSDGGYFGDDQYIKEYYYSNIFAIAVAKNQLAGFRRIWFDNKLVYSYDDKESEKYDGFSEYFRYSTINQNGYSYDHSEGDELYIPDFFGGSAETGGKGWTCKFYNGSESQEVAEEIKEKEGDLAVNFKGISYFMFTFEDLTDWGHRMPSIEVEVVEQNYDLEPDLIDENDSITLVNNSRSTYNYNLYDAMNEINTSLVDIEYDYRYNEYRDDDNGDLFVSSSSKNIDLIDREYNGGLSYDYLSDKKTDYRFSINEDGPVILNGEKKLQFLPSSYNITSKNLGYYTANENTNNSRTKTDSTFLRIREEDYAYRKNFPYGTFAYDYYSKIENGIKSGSVIATNSQYSIFFIEESYDYYDGKDSVSSEKTGCYVRIDAPGKTIEIREIDGKPVHSFFYYNHLYPSVVVEDGYDENGKCNRIAIYTLEVSYSIETRDFEYNSVRSDFINDVDIYQYSSNINIRRLRMNQLENISDFYFNTVNVKSTSTQNNGSKTLYDPRFNCLIKIENIGFSITNHLYMSVIKINNGNLEVLIDREKIEIAGSDEFIANYMIHFNQCLNIVSFAQSQDNQDFFNVYETKVSYFKNGELANDFRVYLDDVVKDLLIEASYNEDDIDVSDLSGVEVTGYIYGSSTTSRDYIQKLQSAYLFDIYEEDFKIKAKMRGGDYVREFSAEEVGFYEDSSYNDESIQYKTTAVSAIELPSEVIVGYSALNNAYTETTQKSEIIVDHELQLKVDLPLSMTDDKAKQVSDIILTASHREIFTYEFNLDLVNIDLNVSDIIKLEDKYVRITDINVTETHIEVTGVSDASNAYHSNVTGTNSNNGGFDQSVQRETTSDLLLFNAKPLYENQLLDDVPIVFCVALPRENKISNNLMYDATSSDLVDLDTPQIFDEVSWGELAEDNVREKGAGFDTSTLVVDFINFDGSLETVTNQELFVDKKENLIALVSGANVEYIQAGQVDVVDNQYHLTNLLRERYNSRYIDAKAGAKVVVIDENVYSRSYSLDEINRIMYAKLVSGSLSLSSIEASKISITGENLKPHPVVNLRYVDDLNGNGIISYNVVVNDFGNGRWSSGHDVYNNYIDFIIELYDENEDLLGTFETEEYSKSIEIASFPTLKYVTVTSRNKRVDIRGDAELIEI